MFDLFYDQTCNIRTEWYTRVRWSEVPSKTPKHTGIACFFEKRRWNNRQVGLAREQDTDRYELYLDITYKDVIKWDIVELIEWTSIGEYIVDTVTVYNTTGSTVVDNVVCTVSPR